MSEIEVEVGVLKERVDSMEKRLSSVVDKSEKIMFLLFTIMGGVIVNLAILLIKG